MDSSWIRQLTKSGIEELIKTRGLKFWRNLESRHLDGRKMAFRCNAAFSEVRTEKETLNQLQYCRKNENPSV